MEDNTPVPCENCITLAICKSSNIRLPNNIGPLLTLLGKKCYMISDYILLKDLRIRMPKMDVPMEKRRYFTVPQAQRVVKVCTFMNWTDTYDLSFYYDLAYGGGT